MIKDSKIKYFYKNEFKSLFFQKLKSFSIILEEISTLSVAQKMKVAAMAVKMDFSKIASFGYNGTYPGCPINHETGGTFNYQQK